MADADKPADLTMAYRRGKDAPPDNVAFIDSRDMPQDEEGAPRYSALVAALRKPSDPETDAKLRKAATIAIKTLRHEVEDKAKDVDDAIREIKQLRLDVAAAKQAKADEVKQAKDQRSKAFRIAQDRVAALEVQLAAWKAEPLISRIWRAWRGI